MKEQADATTLDDHWSAICRQVAAVAAIIRTVDPHAIAAATIVANLTASGLDPEEPVGHIAEILDHLADATEALALKLGVRTLQDAE